MLAFSNDYYGFIFRVTQSVELFCTYPISVSVYTGKSIYIRSDLSAGMAGVPTWGYYKYYLLHGTSIETEVEKCRCKCRTYNHQCKRGWILFKNRSGIKEQVLKCNRGLLFCKEVFIFLANSFRPIYKVHQE